VETARAVAQGHALTRHRPDALPARLFAVVPAAGGGSRFGAAIPKQYADLAGQPMLACTLDRLCGVLRPAATAVVLAPEDTLYARVVGVRPDVVVLRCGGATRAASVANALEALAPRCAPDDWVLVHDAARPCVPAAALSRLVAELERDAVGGLLAVPVADTLKRAAGNASDAAPRVLATEERAGLWQAQTPQMFRYHLLRAALARPAALAATDEAAAVEALAAAGECAMPRLVLGSSRNIKVTFAGDLALAAAILALPEEGG
jgi:2-C-methyl-D-erythritol 4-phosphate cytidylyltransferase